MKPVRVCPISVCIPSVPGRCQQGPRQWGGVAICRGKLGVANHSCCLTLCCLSLSGSAENISLLCQDSAPCYKGKLMFLCLFSSLHSLQVSSGSPQGQLYFWMDPFSWICFGIKALWEGKYQLLILGFKNTQSDTLFLFDGSKLQSLSAMLCNPVEMPQVLSFCKQVPPGKGRIWQWNSQQNAWKRTLQPWAQPFGM